MIDLKEFRKSLPDKYKNVSDEEVEKIRNYFDKLANVCFDLWLSDKNKKKQNVINRTNKEATR